MEKPSKTMTLRRELFRGKGVYKTVYTVNYNSVKDYTRKGVLGVVEESAGYIRNGEILLV